MSISRREFLNCALVGSLGLLAVEGAGVLLWSSLPRLDKNGYYYVIDTMPSLDQHPADYPDERFWLTYTDKGLLALFKLCTWDRTAYKWVDANQRFECPVCGSKFTLDGTLIEGSFTRNLDRFEMKIFTQTGTLTTNESGDPIQVEPERIEKIWVNPQKLIHGAPYIPQTSQR